MTLGILPTRFAFGAANDCVLVVDTSGSMNERISSRDSRQKIAAVQGALRQHIMALPEESRVTLIAFNHRITFNREEILSSPEKRQQAIRWVDDLKRQVNGDTHMWEAMRQALTVASRYAKQDPGRSVLLRVFTDGQDNDPAYRTKSADEIIAKLCEDFPEIDSETIVPNIVLLGDVQMEVRSRKFRIIPDPDVKAPMPPIIGWKPEAVQAGKDVTFSDITQKEFSFYDWSVDGVRVSKQKTFTHQFGVAGKHVVRLDVGSPDGLKEYDSRMVDVAEAERPPLAPGFSFLPSAPEPGETVEFVGWAAGQGVTFSWQIEGQEFGASAEAKHVFQEEKNYDVTLKARDTNGRSEEVTKRIVVSEPPVTPVFRAAATATNGQQVQFVNDTAGRVTTWSWDFGDGTQSSEKSPSKAYQNKGEERTAYSVVLSAVTQSGRRSTSSPPHSITIYPSARKPVAGFRVIGAPFKAGTICGFRDESSGVIESYRWDFNGEATASTRDPEFHFDAPGQKVIRLTVQGPGGEDTVAKTIDIRNREVSVTVNWLGTNNQSLPLPADLDFGQPTPNVVRSGDYSVNLSIGKGDSVTNISDEFEVIVPADLPETGSLVVDLKSRTNAFELFQRDGEKYVSLALPARLRQGGRFRVGVSTNAPEGLRTNALVLQATGESVLLNGGSQSATVKLAIDVVEPPFPMWIVVLAVVALAVFGYWLWRHLTKPPPWAGAYQVRIVLEEAALDDADTSKRRGPAEFVLEVGDSVSLGRTSGGKHYDLGAPKACIARNEKEFVLDHGDEQKVHEFAAPCQKEVLGADGRQRSLRIVSIEAIEDKESGEERKASI